MSVAMVLNNSAKPNSANDGMARIAILQGENNSWAQALGRALEARSNNQYYAAGPQEFFQKVAQSQNNARCLYAPAPAGREGIVPDLAEAEAIFQQLAGLRSGAVVLISSALIYGIGPGRQTFATEEYTAPRNGGGHICDQWIALEKLAQRCLRREVQLTVLRPVAVVPSPTFLSKAMAGKFVLTLPGHDPTLQFLSLDDLAQAIVQAFEQQKPGVFNVAPDAVAPLRKAVHLSGSHHVAFPRTWRRAARDSEALDHLRYSWTVSNEKAKKELGFVPAKSSVAALLESKGKDGNGITPGAQFDDFGMDKKYIRFFGKTLFRFLNDFYWRIEAKGLEHVPREGRALLVGMHRGFMPWDGVMALHMLVKKISRYPRFLTHPALFKFPFLFNFMTKLGGVVATQQSADRILQEEGLLGIFPEGIQGAFTSYREAYQLQEFGRDAYVKMALRNSAPIVPFVTVGSAEIFPILGKIKSRFWTRYTGWPYVPLTPTFPLLPVPLPSKWHTQFLPPIHIEKQYGPEAARNSTVVKTISHEVRTRMQQAINEMLGRRHSIFYGSIFEAEAG